jgi:hypothetical protein
MLPAAVRLTLDVKGEPAASWLGANRIVLRKLYLAPDMEADRVRILAAAMERAAASGPLPVPLEALGLTATPRQWRMAAIAIGLFVSQDFLLSKEATRECAGR